MMRSSFGAFIPLRRFGGCPLRGWGYTRHTVAKFSSPNVKTKNIFNYARNKERKQSSNHYTKSTRQKTKRTKVLMRRCAVKDTNTEELRDSLAERDADVARLGADVQAAVRRGEEALRAMSDLHREEVEGARSRSGCPSTTFLVSRFSFSIFRTNRGNTRCRPPPPSPPGTFLHFHGAQL